MLNKFFIILKLFFELFWLFIMPFLNLSRHFIELQNDEIALAYNLQVFCNLPIQDQWSYIL